MDELSEVWPGRVTVSLDDIVTAFGIGIRTVHREIERGNLQTVKIGRRRMVRVSAVRDWMEGRAEAEQEAIAKMIKEDGF